MGRWANNQRWPLRAVQSLTRYDARESSETFLRTHIWRIMLAHLDDEDFQMVTHMPEMQSEDWRVGRVKKLDTSSRITTQVFWRSAVLRFVDISEAGLGNNLYKASQGGEWGTM